MEREVEGQSGAASAVMRTLYQTIVAKKELSHKAKLSIYQLVYFPVLITYGHELWVMMERMRSWKQVAEMRMSTLSFRDRVRNSEIRRGL